MHKDASSKENKALGYVFIDLILLGDLFVFVYFSS